MVQSMTDTRYQELVALQDCPPGLFRFGDILGFRSEYQIIYQGIPLGPEAFCVDSGECFWGGTSSHEERKKVMVQPVTLEQAIAAQPEPRGEREARSGEMGYKGICNYCERAVFVKVGERWCSKGDKVWHLACSHAAPEGTEAAAQRAPEPRYQGPDESKKAEIVRKWAASTVEGLVRRNIIPRYLTDEADAREAIADAMKHCLHEVERLAAAEPRGTTAGGEGVK